MADLDLSLTMGPIIIGAFLCVFLFGLICMQTVNYLKSFPNDSLSSKCIVISIWALQLVYTACICQGAYTMSVTDFGQISALLFAPWGLNAAVIVGSLIDHGARAFFVARIYRVTKALCISLFLWTTIAFLLGVSLVLGAEAIRSKSIPITAEKWRWLYELLFFGDAALDIVDACVLCFYLKMQSRAAFSQSTTALVDQLVVYTLQTGLFTSFVALAAAISFKVAPEDYIWTVFYMAMPCTFVSARLAYINNRKNMSQTPFVVTCGDNLGHGTTVQFSQSVMVSRDDAASGLAGAMKFDGQTLELNKFTARPDVFAV
ncbi:hypothetical protein GGX14DRAFT_616637 [Mycena pura]|uniref:DUF6534 domain-containing protein n=1 Tax=Mycena pura TaxID=153505 RepID=A0AAD6YTU9_9AGAR|nr:hypothetical protein GGX14DRAFT_616637 [Mycena pura]